MTPVIQNGRLPDTWLETVGFDVYGRPARFQPGAAASWRRMIIAGMPIDISDSYRDYARQEDYYNDPPNSAGLAAVPGTSTHGWGLAVDARGACLTWLAQHGAEHGWVRTIAREPWHFEYQAWRDEHRVPPPPVVYREDWFDMATLADLRAVQPAEVVYFTKAGETNGAIYEAVLRDRTYAHVPTEDILKRRRDVLTVAGVKWIVWRTPVENAQAFGRQVPWGA